MRQMQHNEGAHRLAIYWIYQAVCLERQRVALQEWQRKMVAAEDAMLMPWLRAAASRAWVAAEGAGTLWRQPPSRQNEVWRRAAVAWGFRRFAMCWAEGKAWQLAYWHVPFILQRARIKTIQQNLDLLRARHFLLYFDDRRRITNAFHYWQRLKLLRMFQTSKKNRPFFWRGQQGHEFFGNNAYMHELEARVEHPGSNRALDGNPLEDTRYPSPQRNESVLRRNSSPTRQGNLSSPARRSAWSAGARDRSPTRLQGGPQALSGSTTWAQRASSEQHLQQAAQALEHYEDELWTLLEGEPSPAVEVLVSAVLCVASPMDFSLVAAEGHTDLSWDAFRRIIEKRGAADFLSGLALLQPSQISKAKAKAAQRQLKDTSSAAQHGAFAYEGLCAALYVWLYQLCEAVLRSPPHAQYAYQSARWEDAADGAQMGRSSQTLQASLPKVYHQSQV